MAFSKDDKYWRRLMRGVKTILFLVCMLASLLLVSAPVLFAVADALLPTVLLSASLSPSHLSLSSHLRNYDFKSSLVDIPLISIVRSALILCVYSLCDGPALSRGPYVGITAACSVLSLGFVSVKASYAFAAGALSENSDRRGAAAVLFACSLALAVAHVAAAYRTSCRERRKLLVYKIDTEAVRVTACNNGFPRYPKILQQERVK